MKTATTTTTDDSTPKTEFDAPRRPRYEIGNCGSPQTDAVDHPQRGPMVVCPRHARRIRLLSVQHFPGVSVDE